MAADKDEDQAMSEKPKRPKAKPKDKNEAPGFNETVMMAPVEDDSEGHDGVLLEQELDFIEAAPLVDVTQGISFDYEQRLLVPADRVEGVITREFFEIDLGARTDDGQIIWEATTKANMAEPGDANVRVARVEVVAFIIGGREHPVNRRFANATQVAEWYASGFTAEFEDE